jgi:DNA-binding response OmpR family regulator
MRIIVVDSDINFTTPLVQRWKKASVYCQAIPQAAAAMAELKKDPDGIDIVLIAKELGGGQDGLAVAQMLRKDPATADVPYVLMSSAWGKSDFAKHQKTEFGANAYYSKKDALSELFEEGHDDPRGQARSG